MSDPTIRLTRAQVREIDRRALEQYHIPGIVLMENAARAVVEVTTKMLRGGERVVILCGGGNNGGDGLAVARHLHNCGISIQILFATNPDDYHGDALVNYQIVQKMGLRSSVASAGLFSEIIVPGLVIDGIFGTGLMKAPRPPFDEWAEAINRWRVPVVAIDIPSGLDCNTGEAHGPCIRATRTVTFVAEKSGFSNPSARNYTGEIVVGDIGCPRELIEQVIHDTRG